MDKQTLYQAFEYDSSIVDGDDYKKQPLGQGWQEIGNSKEYEEHGWPLTQSVRFGRRGKDIESFVLKREAAPQSDTGEDDNE